jgi:hypothetical protein
MRNINKYSAMAIVGAGLAFAAASPASACGGFGMFGVPVFGAAFGGCGPVGFAAPVAFGFGGGCAPVAFGCGAMGAVFRHPAFGAAFGGCGCGGYGSVAWRRPIGYGYGYAYHRPLGYGFAYHRPFGYGFASYRHYHPYAFAARHYRHAYSYAAYSPRYHARSYALSRHRFYAMRPSHRLAFRTLSRWG